MYKWNSVCVYRKHKKLVSLGFGVIVVHRFLEPSIAVQSCEAQFRNTGVWMKIKIKYN